MYYRIPEPIETAVTPPFEMVKFLNAMTLLKENIESIDKLNALDNFMNIHVLVSWISDHVGEVNAIPSCKEKLQSLINIFGRHYVDDTGFDTQHTNRSVHPGSIVTPKEVFLGERSMDEIYNLLEDDQDPYVDKILEIIQPYKGALLWYSGAAHMVPPHHCEV